MGSFATDQEPLVGLSENLLHEFGVQRMSGAFRDDMTDEGEAEQCYVSHQIEDLMTDEFIREAKTGLIDDALLGQHDRILQ